MNRLFDRIFGSTVDAPLLVTLLILLLSGAALLGYYDPDRVTSLLKPRAEMEAVPEPAPPQPKDDKQKTEIVDETPKPKPQPQIPDVDAVSLTDSDVILVVKSKQFFTPEGAALPICDSGCRCSTRCLALCPRHPVDGPGSCVESVRFSRIPLPESPGISASI